MKTKRHEEALNHAQAGRIQEAFTLYGQILNEDRDDCDALHFFAVLDIHQSQFEQAYEKTSRIRDLRPDWAKACNTHGSACFKLGKLDEAYQSFLEGLEIEPTNLELMQNFASLNYQQKKFQTALTYFKKIAALLPKELQPQLDVVESERQLGHLDTAKKKAEQLLTQFGSHALIHNALANILKQEGQATEALSHYNHAIKLDDSHGLFYGNMGATLIDLGKPAEAKPYLLKSIALNPTHSEPYYLLSRNLENPDEARDLIAKVTSAQQRPDMDPVSQSDFEFALYGCLHFLGEDTAAFEHVLMANKLRYQLHPFDTDAHHRYYEKIKAWAIPDAKTQTETGTETPIFVLGMPRSGTTLVEQIITAHSDVTAGGELPFLSQIADALDFPNITDPFPISEIEQAKTTYLEKAGMNGTAFFTDKMPANFQYIGLIKTLWPNAKIVHCTRHPMDTCLSNYQMRFSRAHHYIYDQTDLGLYYRAYHDLMEHWIEQFGDQIYTVRYEDVVADQEGESRKLLEYCGLDWRDVCLDFHKSTKSVRTASATQVRKKIYQSALNRWKRYEAQLQPLRTALGELVPD